MGYKKKRLKAFHLRWTTYAESLENIGVVYTIFDPPQALGATSFVILSMPGETS